jgi:hypothetical protein
VRAAGVEEDDHGVDLECLDLIFFDEKNRDAEAEVLEFFAGVEDDYSYRATARWRQWSSAWFLASKVAEKIREKGRNGGGAEGGERGGR